MQGEVSSKSPMKEPVRGREGSLNHNYPPAQSSTSSPTHPLTHPSTAGGPVHRPSNHPPDHLGLREDPSTHPPHTHSTWPYIHLDTNLLVH